VRIVKHRLFRNYVSGVRTCMCSGNVRLFSQTIYVLRYGKGVYSE